MGLAWRKERARGARGGFRFVRYKWGSFNPGSARLRPIHVAVRPNAQGGFPISWTTSGKRNFDALCAHLAAHE